MLNKQKIIQNYLELLKFIWSLWCKNSMGILCRKLKIVFWVSQYVIKSKLYNDFLNGISQEIDLYVVGWLYRYFYRFALFLEPLHNLIKELIKDPASKKLDYTTGQWNRNFDQCISHAVACLNILANIKNWTERIVCKYHYVVFKNKKK